MLSQPPRELSHAPAGPCEEGLAPPSHSLEATTRVHPEMTTCSLDSQVKSFCADVAFLLASARKWRSGEVWQQHLGICTANGDRLLLSSLARSPARPLARSLSIARSLPLSPSLALSCSLLLPFSCSCRRPSSWVRVGRFLWNGQGLVKRWASRAKLASYEVYRTRPSRMPQSIHLTPRGARATSDPKNQRCRAALFALHRPTPSLERLFSHSCQGCGPESA